MKKGQCGFLFILMLIGSSIYPVLADDDPARVLVIYNLDYPDENGNQVGDSQELAIHYMESRNIPWQNLVGLHCKTGTYYSLAEWTDFWNEIVVPVQERLQILDEENILFMVTCYGVPFTVAVGGDHSTRSLDNALMNIYNLGTETTPSFPFYWNGNPYLESSPSIAPDVPHFNHTYTLYGQNIYPVTRLDGDTVNHAKAMVDGALYGEKYIDSGAGVRSPQTNWRFLAQALARGVTAGAGVTGEPYLTGHPRPEVLLHFILNGYNYAEAAFASNPALSWRVILYGDPLYNPTKVKTPEPDVVAPPIPIVSDYPPAGFGDTQRMIIVDIDAGTTDQDLVVTRIEYGETPGFGSVMDYGLIYQIHHEVLLESLTPDTDYYYQVAVRNPPGWRTAPQS